MKPLLVALFLALFCPLFCLGTAVPARGESLNIPLMEMTPQAMVTLQGINPAFEMSIPVPARWQVQSARLQFSYVNSTTLIPEQSRLIISVNGAVLGQIILDPRSPEGAVEIAIPAKLLRAAYNSLVFRATQTNSDDECVDPNAPDIWTKINLGDSSLDIEYMPRPVPMELAAVADFIFDPKQAYDNKVHLALENLDEETLRQAAWLAYGVAARFEYRHIRFSVGRMLRTGMDNIVLGSRKFAQSLAPHVTSNAVGNKGAALGIAPLSVENGANAAVLVMGETAEERAKAAQAFSVLSYPLPDSQYAVVQDVIIPEITPYSGRLMVAPDEKYYFKDLGYSSTTFWGMSPGSREITFMLPSDVRIQPNSYFGISLHIAYGSEMRRDSVVNITINDKFGAAIPLNSEEGGIYRGYAVTVPGYLLKQGLNTLRFSPTLTPLITGNCLFIQEHNLVVSLFDDSHISVPPMNHWIAMPELKATFTDGFPFMKWPDWRDTLVVLSEKSSQSAAAALNLVAMLAQKKRICPLGIEFAYTLPQNSDKDLLVLGAWESLPTEIKESTPISPEISYPYEGDTPALKRARGFWARLYHSVIPEEEHYETTASPPPAKLRLKTGLDADMLLLSQFESPLKGGRTAFVLTASSGPELLQGVQELWNPSLQGAMTGDTSLVRFSGKKPQVYNQKAAETYYVGQVTAFSGLDYLLHTYPLLFAGIMLAFVLLAVVLLLVFLRQRKKKRLSNA